VLLEPTTSYVRAALQLLRSDAELPRLAHLTRGARLNLPPLSGGDGDRMQPPLPVLPIFELIRERSDVDDAEMLEVFNMGCGFCCVVPASQAEAAVELLAGHHRGAAVIGDVTDKNGTVELPTYGLSGRLEGFAPA